MTLFPSLLCWTGERGSGYPVVSGTVVSEMAHIHYPRI